VRPATSLVKTNEGTTTGRQLMLNRRALIDLVTFGRVTGNTEIMPKVSHALRYAAMTKLLITQRRASLFPRSLYDP
jgi:hypothetical protein